MTQQELEAEVMRLREEMDILISLMWGVRGYAKSEQLWIEKELEAKFKEMLDRKNPKLG